MGQGGGMSTPRALVDELLASLPSLELTARAMFGEYGLYLDGRMAALVCDSTLFVKPSAADAPPLEQAPPYPGAKPALVVPHAEWDADWLPPFLTATAAALPLPKKRR